MSVNVYLPKYSFSLPPSCRGGIYASNVTSLGSLCRDPLLAPSILALMPKFHVKTSCIYPLIETLSARSIRPRDPAPSFSDPSFPSEARPRASWREKRCRTTLDRTVKDRFCSFLFPILSVGLFAESDKGSTLFRSPLSFAFFSETRWMSALFVERFESFVSGRRPPGGR